MQMLQNVAVVKGPD